MIYLPLIRTVSKLVGDILSPADVIYFNKTFTAEAMSCGIRITERKALTEYFQKAAYKALNSPHSDDMQTLLTTLESAIEAILIEEPMKLAYADVLLFRKKLIDDLPVLKHSDATTWQKVFGIIDNWRTSTVIADEVWQSVAEILGCETPDHRNLIRGVYYEIAHPLREINTLETTNYSKWLLSNTLEHKWGVETVFLTENEADLVDVDDYDVWVRTEQITRYSGKAAVRAFRHEILCYKLNKRPVLFVKGMDLWIGPSDLEQLRYTEGLYEQEMPTIQTALKHKGDFPRNNPHRLFVKRDKDSIVCGTGITIGEPDIILTPEFQKAVAHEVRKQIDRVLRKRLKRMGLHRNHGRVDDSIADSTVHAKSDNHIPAADVAGDNCTSDQSEKRTDTDSGVHHVDNCVRGNLSNNDGPIIGLIDEINDLVNKMVTTFMRYYIGTIIAAIAIAAILRYYNFF